MCKLAVHLLALSHSGWKWVYIINLNELILYINDNHHQCACMSVIFGDIPSQTRGLKAVTWGDCVGTFDSGRVSWSPSPPVTILTHVCFSCCNSHRFYFGKLLRRKAICMDCSSSGSRSSSSLRGRGAGGVLVVFRVDQKEENVRVMTGGEKKCGV